MIKYFIHDGKGEAGPFSIEQLKYHSITSITPIWYEGLDKWTTAGNIPELREFLLGKSGPPPLTVEKEPGLNSYTPMMNEYFPTSRKSSWKNPLLTAAIITTVAVIIWLISKNIQNTTTIASLKNREITQQQERNRKEAEEHLVNERKKLYRNNWEKYITMTYVKPAIYYTMGGIGAFEVLIRNQTDYIIDQVDVEVNYIRKSGEIWQTRDISFFNIPVNYFAKGIAPPSVNGVEVSVKIKKIICKKMEFCYPVRNGSDDDPYYCE